MTAVGRTSYRQSQLTERDKRLGAEVTRSSTPWLPRDKKHLLVKIDVDLMSYELGSYLTARSPSFSAHFSLIFPVPGETFGLARLIAQDKL
jgi:hypothetical protein